VALFFILYCASFDQTASRVIVAANGAQDSAAQAYTEAKTATVAAGKTCGEAGRAAGIALPPITDKASGAAAIAACKALGVNVPYNPFVLNQLVGPLNAAYDAIRGLNDARVAVKAGQANDFYGMLNKALGAVTQFYAAAKEAGLTVNVAPLERLQEEAKHVK
jgi:hypothetical protein